MGKKIKSASETINDLKMQVDEAKKESQIQAKAWRRGREDPLERLQELKKENDKLREEFSKAREIKRGLTEENNVHISNLIQATHELKEMEQRIEKLKEKQNSGEQQVEEINAEDLQKKEQLRKQ